MSSPLEALLTATVRNSLEVLKRVEELDWLSLHSKRLTSVPESIGQLTNLTLLYLNNNQLSSLPKSIGRLTNLVEFHLNDNQLSSLPESIGQLTNLKVINLSDNKLSFLPESIRHLTNLKVVNLSDNILSSLPESIGQLTSLTELSILDNPITELPESITRLKNLKKIQIECWGRTTIQRAPIGITALPCYSNNEKDSEMTMSYSEALKKLKLYSNHINENLTDISSLIGKWKACDRINISNNKISTLPDQLSTLTVLCDFNISNNMFAMFPDVLLKMSWLTSLNIAGNSFTELPEGITKLAKLANLEIKDSNGKISIQRAPANISTLPCYNANADLKKLAIVPARVVAPVIAPVIAPAPVQAASQAPIVEFPTELQQFVLSVAPTFNKTEKDKLGEGGQATVYKGTYQGKSVAIKVIKPDAENVMKDAADEVILTKKIPHQNIVNIIGVYLSLQGMLIVMELGSDSLNGMIDKRKGPLTPREIVTFGKQISDALNYCVTQNPKEPIHHRDLKTENVLIVNGQAKLADFGLAHKGKRTGFSTRMSGTKLGGDQSGTPFWQGPEIYNVACKGNADTEELGAENIGHRGEMSDVYAVGLILWSMATGKYPFSEKSSREISPLLLQGERPEIPADVHPTLAHIIRACWRQNYKLRPRFSKVVAVLSMCGAGNLDAVSKEILNQLVPIRYSPIGDMYSGELYEYLTEQGVSQPIAQKLRAKPMNGDSFSLYNARKFVDTFKISEAEAQKLVLLQNLASDSLSISKTDGPTTQASTSPSTTSNSASITAASPPPSTRTAASMQAQPSERTIRTPPPKPIVKMNTDELVAYLKAQKRVLPSFIQNIQDGRVSGETLLYLLEEDDLRQSPYSLDGVALEKTLKFIEELKLL